MIYRTVDEIMTQAFKNVLHNIICGVPEPHTEVLNKNRCNKSAGKQKYLKKQQRRNKSK